MQKLSNTTRQKRKATTCPPDLFAWSQDTSLLSTPSIRAIVRRAQVSPAVAAVISELSGLGRGSANV
jgi:hypothetical protein